MKKAKIEIRVTEEFKEELTEIAECWEMSVSEYIRTILYCQLEHDKGHRVIRDEKDIELPFT